MSRTYGAALGSAAATLFQACEQVPQAAPLIGPVGALLAMMAADIDDHIARRLRQGEQVKALLREARPLLPSTEAHHADAALTLALAAPDDFALASVEAYAAALDQALIRVHVWLETPQGRRHPELLDKVWAQLRAEVAHVSRGVVPLW